jgi:hypothetical protein
MAKFEVVLPIVGYAYIEVEANSLDEAWIAACQQVDYQCIEEWYPVKTVATGNVLYHPKPHRSIHELLT